MALRQQYPIQKATGLLKVPIAEFSDAIVDLLDLADARAENQEVKELELGDERAAKEKKKGNGSRVSRGSSDLLSWCQGDLLSTINHIW